MAPTAPLTTRRTLTLRKRAYWVSVGDRRPSIPLYAPKYHAQAGCGHGRLWELAAHTTAQ